MLIGMPPLLIVAACAEPVLYPGNGRRMRPALLLLILLAGRRTRRTAYRELRWTKKVYADVVALVQSETSRGDFRDCDVTVTQFDRFADFYNELQ